MPDASQPKRGPTRTLLAAIKAQLVAEEVASEDAIRWAARDETPTFTAEHILILRPKGFVSLRADRDGAGRVTGLLERVLAVHMRVRLIRDESDRDDQWLLNETEGYLDLEDAVVDALDMFPPVDGNGNDLLAYPMRVVSSNDVQKDDRDGMWGDGTVYFAMAYLAKLDQSRL